MRKSYHSESFYAGIKGTQLMVIAFVNSTTFSTTQIFEHEIYFLEHHMHKEISEYVGSEMVIVFRMCSMGSKWFSTLISLLVDDTYWDVDTYFGYISEK